MSANSRNVFGSCLTMMITIVVILGLLVVAGVGVMVLSLMTGA